MGYPAILEAFAHDLITNRGKSEKTAKAYLGDLMLFFRYVETGRNNVSMHELSDSYMQETVTIEWLKTIKPEHVHKFLHYCRSARQNASVTSARKAAAIKTFFSFLKKAGYIKQNVASEIETPRTTRTLPVYLDTVEAKQLLATIPDSAFPERDRCITAFFLYLGLRVSELVMLDIDSIDGDVVRIRGTGRKEREVVLNKACMTALKRYLERERMELSDSEQPEKALFLSREKRRISARTVQRIVKKAAQSCGIPTQNVTPHILRHTFAARFHNAGVSIHALQRMLGHASIATTQIYAHVDNREIRKAMTDVGELYE
jgi:site-specific recombinase XerD